MNFAIVTALTVFRVAVAAIIAIVLWPQEAWLAILILMTIAFVSDLFDGLLARRWHVVSWFGKVADPLADKIICLTVLWLVASYFQEWPFWLAAGIMTAYDVITMTLRFTTQQSAHPVAAASKIAKAKTAILMVSLLLLVVAISDGESKIGLIYEPFKAVGSTLLAFACVLAIGSFIYYLQQIKRPKESHENKH